MTEHEGIGMTTAIVLSPDHGLISPTVVVNDDSRVNAPSVDSLRVATSPGRLPYFQFRNLHP